MPPRWRSLSLLRLAENAPVTARVPGPIVALAMRPGLGGGALFAGALLASLVADAGQRTLRQVVYDYAVTSYCGLLTPEVTFGFQRELEALSERSGLSPAEAKALRIAGWVDADREWSNRGLGGFRAWCKDEGQEALRRFLAIARAQP